MGVRSGVSRTNLTEPVQVEVVNGGGGGGDVRLLDADGTTLINPRREDGHGSSSANPTYVESANAFSTLNSTTAPLGTNGVFTGAWEDLSDYISINVVVNTDRIKAQDGLLMQFSTDGVNTDISRSIDITTGGDFVSFPVEARFFRLVIQNDGGAQAFLRVQTHYSASPRSIKGIPLQDRITDASTALLSRTVIEGRSSQGGGTYVHVKVDPAGKLLVDASGSTVAVTGTQLDALTDAELRAAPVQTFDSSDSEYLRFAGSVTTVGDTTLITPTAGKRIRLQWVYAINDPVANNSTKITIKLGSAVQYVAWAISKRQQLTGGVDDPLVINLTQTGDVAVTVFYQEVD